MGIKTVGFESDQIHKVLAMCPWADYLIFCTLVSLSVKMWITNYTYL